MYGHIWSCIQLPTLSKGKNYMLCMVHPRPSTSSKGDLPPRRLLKSPMTSANMLKLLAMAADVGEGGCYRPIVASKVWGRVYM
jgi:hypothetical protein